MGDVSSIPPDIHDEPPEYPYSLPKVGIRSFVEKTSINLLGCEPRYYTIEAYIELPPDKKGAHLSRIVRLLKRVLSKNKCYSPEEILDNVLTELLVSHPYSGKAEVSLQTTLKWHEHRFDLKLSGVRNRASSEGKLLEKLEIKTVGITSCPCAKQIYGYYEGTDKENTPTHMQRAVLTVVVEGEKFLQDIKVQGKIAEAMLQSFSGNTNDVLDRISEYKLIKRTIRKPLFAEDVVRKVKKLLDNLLGERVKKRIFIESLESIHDYNVYAELGD